MKDNPNPRVTYSAGSGLPLFDGKIFVHDCDQECQLECCGVCEYDMTERGCKACD